MSMSDVITPPHFSSHLLLISPPPNFSSLLFLISPPHSSSFLLLTPPPHFSSLLLLISPHSSSSKIMPERYLYYYWGYQLSRTAWSQATVPFIH
jgi:hypothetical protein